jgi:hypothetical protein
VLSARIGTWMMGCEEEGLDIPVEAASSSLNNSRQSSISLASSSRGSAGRSSYPSPIDEAASPLAEINGNHPTWSTSRAGSTASAGKKLGKGKEVKREWVVPEENRVRLVMVDFHIPEKYIKVKCQKALPGAEGTYETVIGW